jgi:hypothetical protein
MARQFRFWQDGGFVVLLPPAADAAGRTSMFVSLRYGHKTTLICGVNQGNAATVLWTPLQATDSLGTNSKALTNPAPIAYNADTSNPLALTPGTGTDQFTMPGQPAVDGITVVAAANFTTGVALKNKIVMFEIDAGEVMDVNNIALAAGLKFDHIGVSTGASNAANITWAALYQFPMRDVRQNPPTLYI